MPDLKSKNKIIYINSVNIDEKTGQSSFERNFISYMRSLSNQQVVFLTIGASRTFYKDGTYYIKLNKNSFTSYFLYIFRVFFILMKEIVISRKKISLYTRLAPYNLAPIIFSLIPGIGLTVRSGPLYQNLTSYGKIKNKKLLKIFKFILRLYYRRADKIICVTDIIKQRIVSDFNIEKNKIYVISNPINDDIFSRCELKDEVTSKLNTIGFIGNIYKDQGVHHLISAINILVSKNNFNNSRVTIVGGGDYFTQCELLIQKYNLKDMITMVGPVTPNEVPLYIQNFDICVAPFTENDYKIRGSSALKIMEYLYCNKPVVTIDVNEYRFIKDNSFGLLYKADNINDLADAIFLLMKQQPTIESKSFVTEHMSKSVIFKKYLKLIINNNAY
jgi:glycosyltransferase involved in cell wall biosynthesis